MKNTLVCLFVVVAAVQSPLTAASVENEPPVVDAGLDQTVVRGATVYLDAGASYDPDGTIRTYEWSITTPNGTEIGPDCRTCERTSFVPTATGTYAVTVIATDDEGATGSDTLYVNVTDGTGPTVTLTTDNGTSAADTVAATATVESGTAPLDRLVWVRDGTRIGTEELDGDRATVSRTLSTDGSEQFDLRVVAVDDATYRDEASTRIGRPDSGSGNDSSGTDDGSDGFRYGSLDDLYVAGPELITGSEPLRETYEIVIRGRNVSAQSVEWRVNGTTVATGRTADIEFLPGTHDLTAFVTTGRAFHTVGFADGSTTVVADPAPNVSFDSLRSNGTDVLGSVSATDRYGDTDGLRVVVDDTTIASVSTPRGPIPGNKRILPFRRSLSPNTTYDVVAIATDDRGQTDTVTETVRTGRGSAEEESESSVSNDSESDPEVDPDPTVVSSEFVGGPVDSYDERIGSSRYLAEHVTRIDLDGADPGSVEVTFNGRTQDIRRFDPQSDVRYDEAQDLLVVRSYLAGVSPGTYEATFDVVVGGTVRETVLSSFEVTPSQPEPRLDVEQTGTEYDVGKWGMVVDASQSFDPDGFKIDFDWKGSATALSQSSRAKMDSRGRASLRIISHGGDSTTVEGEFLDYFNPGLNTIERTTVDRLTGDGEVVVRVATPVYAFTKETYDADLSIEVLGEGRVLEWENRERDLDANSVGESGEAENPLEQWYTGLVVVNRDELDDGPEIRVYNDAEPHVTGIPYSVPDEDASTETYNRRNLTVESVRYEVTGSYDETVETDSPAERDEYREQGFEVVGTYQEPVEYQVEQRFERTIVESEQRTFETSLARDQFVATSGSEWRATGQETVQKSETTTETVWRDSRSGPGEYTGETRTVAPDGAETQTEFEYVERTTETVVVRERITVPTPSGPPREMVVTREKTVHRERTYWAENPRGPTDKLTGNRREAPVGDGETEYEYRIERTNEKSVERYVAERTFDVTSDQWRDAKTLRPTSNNRQLVQSRDDLRIENVVQRTNWKLRRNASGTRLKDSFEREDAVNRTIVYVSGELLRRDVAADSTEVVEQFRVKLTFDGALTEEEILNRISEREGETVCSGDDPIVSGCEEYKDDE